MRIPNIIIYVSILISLLLYVGVIIFRLLPFDFNHVVYICQSILQSLPNIVIYAFFSIFGLTMLKLLIDYFFMTKYAKSFHSIPPPQTTLTIIKKYNLENKIVVYKSEQPSAFCIGILRPKIFISSGMIQLLNKTEMEAVILHEVYHLKHKNNLMVFVFNTFSYILFIFPFIKDLKRQYEIHEETEADKHAHTYLKGNGPIVNSLKKLLLYEEPVLKYGFAFSKTHDVEYRIRSIIQNRVQINTFSFHNILISLFSFTVLSVLLFLPVTKTHVHAQGRDVMVMCYDNDNCQQMCKSNHVSTTLLDTSINRSSLLTPYSSR